MNVIFLLARRISLSSGGRKSSPAVRVAVAAVALSLLVMMCAIAIVTGFKNEISDKVAGFNSHLTILPESVGNDNASEQQLVTLTPTLSNLITSQPYVADLSLQAVAPAIFKTSSEFKGTYLKSLTGASLTEFLSGSLTSGYLPDYKADSCVNQIVISRKVADQLDLKCGDKIDTYFITDAIRVRPLRVAGIFNSHFDNYDESFSYGSLSLVQELGGLSPNQGTSLVVAVKDFSNVDNDAFDMRLVLSRAYNEDLIYRRYRVVSARQAGAAYFQWLQMLDMNVIVILVLMSVVACVTLVSGMLILMLDKIRFIALMSALGAPRRMISRIFILMAARIAMLGIAIGDILALILLYAQKRYHIIPLDPETYYIDFVPVEISIPAMLILNISVILLIWIVLIIPSKFAGKAAPARTLATE